MNKPSMRRCIGCRESFDKKELIRIVRTPGGEIEIDEKGKADGRGAYICRKLSCLNTAFKKNKLDYSFKIKVSEEKFKKIKERLSEIVGDSEGDINSGV